MRKVISIVTPSLNQGKYIEQTIRSVINQAGDFYIDYIIADGGSNDGTIEIIKKYDELLKTEKFIPDCLGISYRWWSKPDKGQASALNMGFKEAKGDILAWINSDDYYEPGTFNSVLELFKKNPQIDMLHANGRLVDEKGSEKTIIRHKKINLKILLDRGCYVFQPSTFFTKKSFLAAGGLNEQLNYVFDYDLWIKLVKEFRVMHYNEILSNFREWENSKTVLQSKNFFKEERWLRRRYGGNIINFKYFLMWNKKYKLYRIKRLFPGLSKAFLKVFLWTLDKIKYKPDKQRIQ